MITVEYCRLMTRYNQWQNHSFIRQSNGLSDNERWQNRGASFGSIAATLNHLLWDDALWLARFSGDEKPETHITLAQNSPTDWGVYKSMRIEQDEVLLSWADQLSHSDLEGNLSWYPGGAEIRISKPVTLCTVHLFNHQTHHRGQIHAMLKGAGVKPPATDIPVFPF